jgi:hypothetical protein
LVFRPIGKPASLNVSPPCGIDGACIGAADVQEVDAKGKIPTLRARLAYFNLHGLVDAPEWYGQRDPSSGGADPDYPVALRPKDILVGGKDDNQLRWSLAGVSLHFGGATGRRRSLSFLQPGSLCGWLHLHGLWLDWLSWYGGLLGKLSGKHT